MEVIIKIEHCDECKYQSHTGSFTPGGAKPCCNHPMTVRQKGTNCFDRVIPYKSVWYETWKRNVRVSRGIPSWCPVKNGLGY